MFLDAVSLVLYFLGMTQWLRELRPSLRMLVFVAAAAGMLGVAAGMGAIAALMLEPDQGSPEAAKAHRAGEARPEQTSEQESTSGEGTSGKQESTSASQSEAEYLEKVGSIQNGAVEVVLESNDRLLRYDNLTADDIEEMKANYAALGDYREKAEDLDPPEGYEDQHEVFVTAIGELYAANELAYRLAADPVSATQADFEAYDRHLDSATAGLRRSNELSGEDYNTAQSAGDIAL